MNSTRKAILIGASVVVIGLFLFGCGVLVGRFGWTAASYGPLAMMAGYGALPGERVYAPPSYPCELAGPGMMRYGHGMLGLGILGDIAGNGCNQVYTDTVPSGYGMMGPGMIGGMGYRFNQVTTNTIPYGHGMMASGMMGSFGSSGLLGDVEPLSLEEAEAAVQDYLAALGNDDLELHEVMIFDNHAYAEVVETSTGIGALEVLVDPASLAVFPEPGPNMMWNLKYGHMAGVGMMGGMMGNSGWSGWGGMMGTGRRLRGLTIPSNSADMPVSPAQATEAAQSYLDSYLPGSQVEEEVDPFYGYYTLHIERDGQTVGMLSVNGYTGQVFPHTWHGDFLEMSED